MSEPTSSAAMVETASVVFWQTEAPCPRRTGPPNEA